MPAQLPERLVHVREIGDTEWPFWLPASLDGRTLHLDDGEEVLWSSTARIRAPGWELPSGTPVVVTTRRLAWLTTEFDKGGGWTGFSASGMAVALVANAVSKRRAATRRAGKVAIGHVRYEWLLATRLRRKTALLGAVDTYLDLVVETSGGVLTLEIWNRDLTEELIRWFAGTVATHRLLAPGLTADDVATLEWFRAGGAAEDGPSGYRWNYPGARA